MHVCVCVNTRVIRVAGSLVMEHPGEASTPFQGCVLYGTVNGTIGKCEAYYYDTTTIALDLLLQLLFLWWW